MDIETYARKHPKTQAGAVLNENVEIIRRLPEHSRILDIGCAEGYTLQWLRNQFPAQFELVGVDLSSTRIEKAKEKQIDRASFQTGDAERLPIEDGTINFVIASQVIEHVPDDTKMLQEVERVLVPGGRFQIDTVYKKKWALYFYRSPAGWAIDPTHLREYTDIDALIAKFPTALKVDSVRLIPSGRRLNILRSLAFMPDWAQFRIPGYFVIYLSGHKK